MEYDLADATAILERTPAQLAALLDGLPEPWCLANEGPETFSPFDVVGHLIHGEKTDWVVRARVILEHGESHPFDRYDRFAQLHDNAGRPLPDLLKEFAALRRENLAWLRSSVGPEDFDRRGMHPVLGVVTLRQLLASWVVHDMTHLHQISRVLAHQYRGEVGPWRSFMGVLRCDGHSDPS